ncbi:MAG: DUF2007 domain-containing protein [Myxococcales bacterium]|nr:DUF2007 domain-containing protein [Myxococcales bacterium]
MGDEPVTDPNSLVSLAKAVDNAEASALRAYLEVNGVDCIVQAEQHRSMLGVMGPYIELRLLVRAADLEAAEKLLRQYRENERRDSHEEDPELDRLAQEATAALPTGEDDDFSVRPRPVESMGPKRPKRVGVAVVLAVVLTFGTGHLYAGAFWRGAILALAEIAGWAMLLNGAELGALAVGGAVLLDLIGAPFAVRAFNERLRE